MEDSNLWDELTRAHLVAALRKVRKALAQYDCAVCRELDTLIDRLKSTDGIEFDQSFIGVDETRELQLVGEWITQHYRGYPRDFFDDVPGVLRLIMLELETKILVAQG